ncbi:hypothetical protein [Pseudophaeobacter sp.]|uniref:hypothetical protein n=1 Tax=Pseudophaeobacter sp. TaxID=1971739 RepID=UPI003297221E
MDRKPVQLWPDAIALQNQRVKTPEGRMGHKRRTFLLFVLVKFVLVLIKLFFVTIKLCHGGTVCFAATGPAQNIGLNYPVPGSDNQRPSDHEPLFRWNFRAAGFYSVHHPVVKMHKGAGDAEQDW